MSYRLAFAWLHIGKFVELAEKILLFVVEQSPENEVALSKLLPRMHARQV